MPLAEVEHLLELAEIDVVEHEVDEVVVGEDLEVFESLVLLMDFVEDSLLVEFLQLHVFFLLVFLFFFDLVNSLIEQVVSVAAPLKHPRLVAAGVPIVLVKLCGTVVPVLPLAAEAVPRQVRKVVISHLRIIKLEPPPVVWRLWVPLLDVAVVVPGIRRSRVDEHTNELVLIFVELGVSLLIFFDQLLGGPVPFLTLVKTLLVAPRFLLLRVLV